jgi:hypothetical protein
MEILIEATAVTPDPASGGVCAFVSVDKSEYEESHGEDK